MVLTLHGVLGASDAPRLRETIPTTAPTVVLDFMDVSSISFAALRAILSAARRGCALRIENASPEVFAFVDSTGVTSEIPITLAPRKVSLDSFHRTGGGYTAESWFSNDGDSMLKLFANFVDCDEIDREKRADKTTLGMGIPTPFSGEMARAGDRTGILYELISNKKSIARAIADDPGRTDELAQRMARISRRLHETPGDKHVFGPWSEVARRRVSEYQYCTDEERQAIYRWLGTVEDTGTSLHGDFHIGNVIVTGEGTLFIDMGDVSYGNPLFDLGCMYFTCKCNDADSMDRYFHNTPETMSAFWDAFARYYFDLAEGDDTALAQAAEKIAPFAGLTCLHFSNRNPHMLEETRSYVRTLLVDRVM